jgi:hypothetical protein
MPSRSLSRPPASSQDCDLTCRSAHKHPREQLRNAGRLLGTPTREARLVRYLSHMRGQDAAGVAVKVVAGPAVRNCGARVGVAGGDLHIAQVTPASSLVVTKVALSMSGWACLPVRLRPPGVAAGARSRHGGPSGCRGCRARVGPLVRTPAAWSRARLTAVAAGSRRPGRGPVQPDHVSGDLEPIVQGARPEGTLLEHGTSSAAWVGRCPGRAQSSYDNEPVLYRMSVA